MARRIPPVNALRIFDAVARHQNLTKAAKELNITQSAVSRQVALLEDYLDTPLFVRNRTGVGFTETGREYAKNIVEAFQLIATSSESVFHKREGLILRLRTYTTFAMLWLIPRMVQFNHDHPDIEILLNLSNMEANFEQDNIDLAIQFGNGKWPNISAEMLFPDVLEPVCSPVFLQQHMNKKDTPEQLLEHRLLVSQFRRSDWDDWLDSAGMNEFSKNSERLVLNNSVLVHQAAISGLGLAIGQTALLKTELESRRLIRPFNKPLQRQLGYYLLGPKRDKHLLQADIFRKWILETAATD